MYCATPAGGRDFGLRSDSSLSDAGRPRVFPEVCAGDKPAPPAVVRRLRIGWPSFAIATGALIARLAWSCFDCDSLGVKGANVKGKINHLMNLIRPRPKLTADLYDPNADRNTNASTPRTLAGVPGPRPRTEQAAAKPPRLDRPPPLHASTGAMAPRARLPADVTTRFKSIDNAQSGRSSVTQPIGRPKKPGAGRLLVKDAPASMPVIFEYPEGSSSSRSSVSSPALSVDVKADYSGLFYRPQQHDDDASSRSSTVESPIDPDMTGRPERA